MAPLATAAACVHPTAAAQAPPAPRFETHIPETADEDLVPVVAGTATTRPIVLQS